MTPPPEKTSILGLKQGKAKSCSLQFCKVLVRNPIRDHFLRLRCKFYTLSLQLQLNLNLSKFLEELIFGTYHAHFGFLNRVVKRRIFRTLLKRDSARDAVPRTNKRNICGTLSFQFSYRWVDWTSQDFKKKRD